MKKTPHALRTGGVTLELRTQYDSPLGLLTLTSDGEALTGLWFPDQAHLPEDLPTLPADDGLPVFCRTKIWLSRCFAGEDPGAAPPLRPRGTAFQTAVWNVLREIPRGTTVSYGALALLVSAARGGKNTSARAVGGAVGRNPISILIPCHRVVGADGSLTGYAGGLWRKTALLTLEGVLPEAETE